MRFKIRHNQNLLMTKSDTLIFIPDISGFTNFVHNTAISHGKHIIKELLELLVEKNELKLEISEIEGDAILFYRKGKLPSVKQLLEQAKSMFLAFHNHLKLYETQRICQCGACSSAFDLTLKVIVHAGNVEEINISNHKKLYGDDVILAHRLLKNDIEQNEYLLLTEELFDIDENQKLEEWVSFENTEVRYDNLEEVKFHYTPLTGLRKWIGEPNYNHLFKKSPYLVKLESEIDIDQESLYELITNFKYRELWNKSVDKIEYDEHKLNQLGEKHVCVINGKRINFETTSGDFGSNKLVYGEKTEDVPFGKDITLYFIMEKLSKNKSKLTLESHYSADSLAAKLLKPLIRVKFKKNMEATMQNIKLIKASDLTPSVSSGKALTKQA